MADSIIRGLGDGSGFKDLAKLEKPKEGLGEAFSERMRDAVSAVDALQKDSESAQAAYASGEEVDLHDVLIKVEEADLAFKAMMEIRTKLVDAYREVMRMGSGG